MVLYFKALFDMYILMYVTLQFSYRDTLSEYTECIIADAAGVFKG